MTLDVSADYNKHMGALSGPGWHEEGLAHMSYVRIHMVAPCIFGVGNYAMINASVVHKKR